MGWFGKIVGGTFGFVFGGPLGMIAGAAFGHMYDASSQQGYTRQRITSQEQIQMMFFVAAFSMLAKIAMVDGGVSQAEQRKVDEFIDRDLHLQGKSRQAAVQIFQTAQQNNGTFDQFAQQFYQIFHSNVQMLELMVDILYRVSYADGQMSQAERTLIQRAGAIFHFSPSQMSTIESKYRARGSSEGSYAVLGLKPEATDEQVKRSYRKLVSEYHPDKIASKGLPEEFITFANEKFREIQGAYEDIRKARNL
jgi:DnaJ like chaperone protein